MQLPLPHERTVELSQALLLLPQVSEQSVPCVQSTTRPLQDWLPVQAIWQP
jgi:hypothetical protein